MGIFDKLKKNAGDCADKIEDEIDAAAGLAKAEGHDD